MMKRSRYMLLSAFLIAGGLIAQDAQVKPLTSKDLPEFPGKEAVMITVVYPPGVSDPISLTQCAMHLFTCWRRRCDATQGQQRNNSHARTDLL